MIAYTHQIPPEGKHVAGDDPVEALDLREEGVRADGPLHYRLRLQVAGTELIASGAVWARFKMRCVRCTAWFEEEVGDPEFLCAEAIPEEDASVDLTPEMREAIILRLSSHPVCREGCKGLCPQCGQDLNVGTCTCRQPGDSRWSALDALDI